MQKKVKPTLYIGLGDSGRAIVEKSIALLKSRNNILTNIIADIVIPDDGLCQSTFTGEQYFKIPFDNDVTVKGVFARNYDKLLNKEEDLYELIRKSISGINQYDKRRPLIEQEYEIGEPQVVLYAPLQDAIGSPIITAILKQIHSIKQEVNYLYSEVTGVFFLPDLFHSDHAESSSYRILSDYEDGEIIEPMLKDSHRVDSGKMQYRPIQSIGKKPALFIKGEDDAHAIDIKDIAQGTLGNCYYLALLGGIARQQPEYIEQMIIDNLDNTYTVRFHTIDGKEKSVTVDNKFWLDKNNKPVYSQIADQDAQEIETWVMIIEKAWAKWHKGYEHTEGGNAKKDDFAIALTGEHREYLDLSETENEAEFFEKMYEHFVKNNLPITFGSKAATEEGDDPVLQTNHAYILKDLSYQNKKVNLYNPHGKDHLYNLDWAYVKRHFTGVTFFELEPFEKAVSKRYKKIRDVEYCRTLASITELDTELNKSEAKGVLLLQYAFIVGNKNSKNVTLGTFQEMLVSLSEFSLMLIVDGFATDNLGIQLGEEIEGKRNRYSSLGFSTILYPEKTFLKSLKNVGKLDILGSLQDKFRNEKFGASAVSADVKHFMSDKKFTNYVDRLRVEQDGGQGIFQPFQYTGNRDQNITLEDYLKNIEKQSEDYEAQTFNKVVIPNIEKREKALSQKLSKDISDKIYQDIDSSTKGVNYAHAFTSTLLREDCAAIDGHLLEDEQDLKSMEVNVLNFYRNRTELPEKISRSSELSKSIRNKERQISKLTNQMQRLLEKVDIELENSRAGGEVSAVNVTNLQTELDGALAEKKKLTGEVAKMKSEYSTTKTQVEKMKHELKDADYRKRLREADLADQQEKIDEHLDTIKENESVRYEHFEYMEELKAKRDKLFKRLLIFLPLLIFGIPALIFTALEIFEPNAMQSVVDLAETSRAMFYGQLLVFGLIIYGLWAFFRYRKKIKKAMDAAEETLKELDQKKVQLLTEHSSLHSDKFQLRFDHLVHSSAYNGIEKVMNDTNDTKNKLDGFKKAVVDVYAEAEAANDSTHFENNLFQSSIIGEKDVQSRKETQTMQQFLSDKEGRTLPNYYQNYTKNQSLAPMVADLESYLDEAYRPLQRKSIGDFIFRDSAIQGAVATNTRFKLLTDASEVYVNLKDYGTGDHTEEIASLYCNNFEDPDSDEVSNLITASGLMPQSKNDTGDKNSISVFRAKKGFPAFQLTIIDECRAIFDTVTNPRNANSAVAEHFFIKQDYAKENIFPTTLTLGTKTDEVRIAFTMGRALGFIENSTKCYCFNGIDLGTTIEESIKYLKSLRGEPVKDAIIKEIDHHLENVKSPAEQKALVDGLKGFMKGYDLDSVDQAILEKLMRSFV